MSLTVQNREKTATLTSCAGEDDVFEEAGMRVSTYKSEAMENDGLLAPIRV